MVTGTVRGVKRTRVIALLALFSAISAVLMYLEFPIPIFPPFLRFDFSDLPVVLASFLFGPLYGVAVAFVKALIHVLVSWSGGVGELANFVVSAAYALAAGIVYKYRKTRGGAVLALAAGTLSMSVVGIFSNYFITLPFYQNFMPLEDIIAACAQLIPVISTKLGVVILGITPFNLFKGTIIGLLTFLIYKRLSNLIKL